MASSGRKPFISYRRADAVAQADRLYDRLNGAFPGPVFSDVSGIDIGFDFADVIQKAIADSAILIAVIGSMWSTLAAVPGISSAFKRAMDISNFHGATGDFNIIRWLAR